MFNVIKMQNVTYRFPEIRIIIESYDVLSTYIYTFCNNSTELLMSDYKEGWIISNWQKKNKKTSGTLPSFLRVLEIFLRGCGLAWH